MAKQSKKPADLNRLAAAIVDHATTEEAPNRKVSTRKLVASGASRAARSGRNE